MPNTATWVRHVTEISRNYVNMQVWNCLPRRRTGIEADIVAIRPMEFVDLGLYLDDCGRKLLLDLSGRLRPVRNVLSRNDKRMARRNRKPIPDCTKGV